jgi:hypothetical protein
MILSLVTANDWLHYSRRWQHYSMPRRYQNPLYTYRRVVGAADYLAAQEPITPRQNLVNVAGKAS